MPKFPKHFVVVRDQQYDIGNGFKLVQDLDSIYRTLSFTMPSVTQENWSTESFRKYDRVQLYFKFFDTAAARSTATRVSMTKVFDGYIDRLEEQEQKEEGRSKTIFSKSTAALLYERSTLVPSFSADIATLVTKAIQSAVLEDLIPNVIIEGVSPTLIFNIDSQKFLGNVFDQMKEKYAVHIYQLGNADLRIRTPFFLTTTTEIETEVFDLQENVFNIDYGEITQNVDTVVVIGTNSVGIAFDPIGLQLKQGVQPEDLQTNISPSKEDLNFLYIFRRDLASNEECQEVARNKLVELARNYTISFNTEFDPTREVGQPFIVNNSNKISASQKWIIKRIETTIQKDQIVSTITGYSNSIVDFPTDILLSSTGLLDTDILEVSEKVENAIQLHQ